MIAWFFPQSKHLTNFFFLLHLEIVFETVHLQQFDQVRCVIVTLVNIQITSTLSTHYVERDRGEEMRVGEKNSRDTDTKSTLDVWYHRMWFVILARFHIISSVFLFFFLICFSKSIRCASTQTSCHRMSLIISCCRVMPRFFFLLSKLKFSMWLHGAFACTFLYIKKYKIMYVHCDTLIIFIGSTFINRLLILSIISSSHAKIYHFYSDTIAVWSVVCASI